MTPQQILPRLKFVDHTNADLGTGTVIVPDRHGAVVRLNLTADTSYTVPDPSRNGPEFFINHVSGAFTATIAFATAYNEAGATVFTMNSPGQIAYFKATETASGTYVWRLLSADVGNTPVAVTASTLTVTPAIHAGKTVTIDAAAGCAVTLPAATGTGNKYRFFIGTTITSNTTVFTATGAHIFGNAWVFSDNAAQAVIGWAAGGATTITLNGTTTGGIKGDLIELEDVATNKISARVMIQATGTEATPFA